MNNDQVSKRIDKVLEECGIDDDFLFFDARRNQWAVNCNDLFVWATADQEPITEKNIEIFEKSVREIPNTTGFELFAARVRKMRPQNACYRNIPSRYWKLFDECGPEREVGLGNPYTEYDRNKGSTPEVWWKYYWTELKAWWAKLLGIFKK